MGDAKRHLSNAIEQCRANHAALWARRGDMGSEGADSLLRLLESDGREGGE